MRPQWIAAGAISAALFSFHLQAQSNTGGSRPEQKCKAVDQAKTTGAKPSEPAVRFVHVSPQEFERLQAERKIFVSGGSKVRIGRRLPDAELADLRGNPWAVAELDGKKVFVSLWATWCLPCRAELPYVEKLYHEAKDLGDIRIVSFNLDENRAAVEAFVHQRRYSFPVIIPTEEYMKELLGERRPAIPRYWLINADRVIVREKVGRIQSEGTWVQEIVRELTDLR